MPDPHDKFINHIMSGGTVLRIDSLNGEYEILDSGDLERINNLGHTDLLMLQDDKVFAVDILEMIFKQQKADKEVKVRLKDIIATINKKNKKDIHPLRLPPELNDYIMDLADKQGHDIKIIFEIPDKENHHEYVIDAQIFADDQTWIMNVYPISKFVGPYKNDQIMDDVDKAVTEVLGDHGMLCFVVDAQDVIDYVANK